MEITNENLQRLSAYLQQTLSPDQGIRREAEKFLESIEGSQNYPLLLLQLLDKAEVNMHIRVSASITFKNYVKRNWRVLEDGPDRIHEADRTAIKKHITSLMMKSPEQFQKQLSDAIGIIGQEDFPAKWPDLLKEMVSYFDSGDFHVINGVLHTAHSLFKRYRHEFKSQALWEEIKFVLDNFAASLTKLFNATMECAKEHSANPALLKVIFSSIVLICKIFNSLNFQDLPEHFEDNMTLWMDHFLTLLQADNKLLQTQDDEEAGLLEQVKSQVCDNVALYAQKYDEEFSPHLPKFVDTIWHLLLSTGQQIKYDLLVSNAIQFLASVAERPAYNGVFEDLETCDIIWELVSNAIQFLASVAERPAYKALFENLETLNSICEKVVVPNMQFRTMDEELFEDNPEEYIRRDIEGSDVDTRRRAACDLVNALCKSFEETVITNFSQYVAALLEENRNNPTSNWKSKDVAIYLVTSLAAKGQTQKHGVTQSRLVNLVDFFNVHVLPDLQAPNVNELPILKADTIKYVMVFRNQLPSETLVQCIPHIMRHLSSNSIVVHSYAAHTLERLFTVKNKQGTAAITAESVKPILGDLLTNLFATLDMKGSTENDYVMKAIMRSMSMMQEHLIPFVPVVIPKLKDKLALVCKNPSKPNFNHYLFESLCITIRVSCKKDPGLVSQFEAELFEPFTHILQLDIQEFAPYVFQLLSLLIEVHSSNVPPSYLELFPFLLAPILWERPGNIPPLVRLLQAYIERGATQIQADKLNGLLGVFQKLIASKTNDHEGFYLLNTIIEKMPESTVNVHVKQIFILLFQRLSSSKTTKYIKNLLVFFCLYAVKYGATNLIELIDGIQPQMFGMVIERLYMQDLQKISGNTERKICAVGLTKVLTEAPAMLQAYKNFWPKLLQALISLFELPKDESTPDDEHFVEIEEVAGYQTAYSQLAFAGKKCHDPVADVPDPKVNLAKHLSKLSSVNPGMVSGLIQQGLQADAHTFLQQYMTAAQVNIA